MISRGQLGVPPFNSILTLSGDSIRVRAQSNKDARPPTYPPLQMPMASPGCRLYSRPPTPPDLLERLTSLREKLTYVCQFATQDMIKDTGEYPDGSGA